MMASFEEWDGFPELAPDILNLLWVWVLGWLGQGGENARNHAAGLRSMYGRIDSIAITQRPLQSVSLGLQQNELMMAIHPAEGESDA
jgi:hypothetical protein